MSTESEVWVGEERLTLSSNGNIDTLKGERRELQVTNWSPKDPTRQRIYMQKLLPQMERIMKQEKTHRRKLERGHSYSFTTDTLKRKKAPPKFPIEVIFYRGHPDNNRSAAMDGTEKDMWDLGKYETHVSIGVMIRTQTGVVRVFDLVSEGGFGQAGRFLAQLQAEARAQIELVAA